MADAELTELIQNIWSRILDLRFYILGFVVYYYGYKIAKTIAFTYRTRQRFYEFPQLPRHWLVGHLVNVGQKLDPSIPRHPDYGFEEIWNELGQPPCFFADLCPVDRGMLIIADPYLAEQIVQPSNEYKYSIPKSDTYAALTPLVGVDSIILREGEVWKDLRKRFNKGFAPAHVNSLSPLVISKTRIFIDKLKAAAKTREVIPLRDYAQDLTTDIITQLTIEKDFQSQSIPDGKGPKSAFGVLTAARKLSQVIEKKGQGINPMILIDFIRPLRASLYEYIYNRSVRVALQEKISWKDNSNTSVASGRAIVQLALSGLEPTQSLISSTVDQIKTFIFAGQDTTATLIQWCAYELSKATHSPRYADIRQKLCAEHDAVFGTNGGPFNALDILGVPSKTADEILAGNRLPYTAAFIKETLRLHPPASTARVADEASSSKGIPPCFLNYRDPVTGNVSRIAIDSLRLYPCQWLIQRNPAVWGEDVLDFRPERWLDEKYVANLPVGAWRPFERGPRNCIGQELAMVEAKVVLCAIARGLEFEKVGFTGRVVNGVQEKEVWNLHNVTTIPNDNMMMRVKVLE